LFELTGLEIAKADRESVRGVRRFRSFLHVQERADHHLHLALVGMAVTGYAGFYFAWRVAVDLYIVLFGGEKNNATHFRKAKSRSHIQGGEHGFHGKGFRLKFFQQLTEQGVHVVENSSGRSLLALGGDAKSTVVEHTAVLSVGLEDAIPRRAGRGGVHTEDAETFAFQKDGRIVGHRSHFTANGKRVPTDSEKSYPEKRNGHMPGVVAVSIESGN
jgi:hypothetical protein